MRSGQRIQTDGGTKLSSFLPECLFMQAVVHGLHGFPNSCHLDSLKVCFVFCFVFLNLKTVLLSHILMHIFLNPCCYYHLSTDVFFFTCR